MSQKRFSDVTPNLSFPKLEEEILQLWKRKNTFQESIDQRSTDKSYIFYDGPPFATGLPHYGHLVASTLKDIVPRYWTMKGYRVERRFGWDTHGLPIEMLMEKKLGLSGPTSIKEYGVAQFNEACRANVLTFTKEWEQVVTRLGRWVDFRNDYKTMDVSFMESIWWVFQQLWERDLVYQDFRVMPFSWRLSTSLSNFEANLDYRDVQDPAVTIKMPLSVESNENHPLMRLAQQGTSLLIWTTTPWTLPSNLAVAVGEDICYVVAKKAPPKPKKDQDAAALPPADPSFYIVAKDLAAKVLGKDCEIVEEILGRDLVGLAYEPLFDYFADRVSNNSYHVISSSHVTTGDGTGLVHMAPDFGEDDFLACKEQGIGVLQSVDDEGNFVSAVRDFAGQNIKEADAGILRNIKERGRLFKQSTIQHAYPYCWRSGTPLIYKAVPAWFVRVEKIREKMVENNKQIHWVPEAVGQKRFGNWLSDARDWNISRNRFWGTPIPIWKCSGCEQFTCIGSIADLEKRVGQAIDDIHPHKIDQLECKCDCGSNMKRIEDVFDCWFESGSMPYAQDHYPFENKDAFEKNYPAQFIAEGLDQTRGWFYTLLVLSTALFDKPPFQNVIVNGMVLAEDGSKMSKSKQNYPSPNSVLDELGADALRAYLINSPIVRAEPLRFSKEGVREVIRSTLLPLVNSWSFFTQYANVDGWTPQNGLDGVSTPDVKERPELDRWLLSMLQSLIREVNTQMEGYYLYKVVPYILEFIDHLTNWYIRRSRKRFWRSVEDQSAKLDKASAYATLYETLVAFSKILAPVLPFLSEAMYQNLVVDMIEESSLEQQPHSVHLCDFPEECVDIIDSALEEQVSWTRQIVSMGRALRERHNLKTRQPLQSVTLVHHDEDVRNGLFHQRELIAEELNVKEVRIQGSDADLTSLSFKANFKTLGRKYGKQMKDAAELISSFTREQWDILQNGAEVEVLGQSVFAEDVIVRREAKSDVVIETFEALVLALETELTPGLIAEGHAREATRRIQQFRKDSGLQISDRVSLELFCGDEELSKALDFHSDKIALDVLASSIVVHQKKGGQDVEDVNGISLGIVLEVMS